MNLRDRARTLLQGLTTSPPAKVQSYNVVCPEGHRLRGQRTVGYQALRCPTCGEGVFVLPQSPLPEPPVPSPSPGVRDRPPRQRGQSSSSPSLAPEAEAAPQPIPLTDPIVIAEEPEDGLDGAVVWLDEGPGAGTIDPADAGVAEIEQMAAQQRAATAHDSRPQDRTGADNGAAERKRAQRPNAKRVAAQAISHSVAEALPAPQPLSVSLAAWVRRRRNPLLFLSVVLVIVATMSLRQWRQHRQDLPRIAALGRVDGLAALDAGEFDKAYQLLSRARHAADALGDAVEGASQIHQGAAEAEVFVQLLPERLESLLDAAGRADPKEWEVRFSSRYKGRTIIIDAHVIATPGTPGASGYELDYQILPDGEGTPARPDAPRAARLDTTGFRLFELSQPKVGDHVTFGAKLASFAFDEVSKEWRVGLEPESGVYMTHPKALEALGWPSFADLPAPEETEP